VRVDGAAITRPAHPTGAAATIELTGEAPTYVGRGGRKLAFALKHFGLDVHGLDALDAGAGTGGFTDCLLRAGATAVVAVDVGHAQLHPALRDDPRVLSREGQDVRDLGRLTPPVDVVVIDVAFLRLRDVLLPCAAAAPQARWMLGLLKPEFELPTRDVPQGGVVRSASGRNAALLGFLAWCEATGFRVTASRASAVPGREGNVETFVLLRPPWPALPSASVASGR